MNHTSQRMQNFWSQTVPFIKENWPKFTDVDLELINGNYDMFFKYYNKFYNNFPAGEAKVRDTLKHFYNKLDDQ